jgi:SAM-dependent methyltransferase
MSITAKFLPKPLHRFYANTGIGEYIKNACSKLKRQFVRPPFPKLENGQINLHLGCGDVNDPRFINIDGQAAPHIHYVRQIDNLSPFQDNSVNLVYACHCLEHFPHGKISAVLAEWFRVLSPDGILRLSVPDFDLLINIYQDNQNQINTILYPLLGGQENKFDYHETAFNRSRLEYLLKKAGFREVQQWYPEQNELTKIDDWSNRQVFVNNKYYPISLNLEAIK